MFSEEKDLKSFFDQEEEGVPEEEGEKEPEGAEEETEEELE
jgi:hypothetical protein